MQILATFDATGLPTGFWPQDGHGPDAPDGATALTEAQWQAFIQNVGTRRWTGGEVAVYAPPAPPLLPRSAFGSALRDALKATGQDGAWAAAMALQSDDARAWWVSAYRDLVPITATKLVRVAGACVPKVDLGKLYDAAGA